MTNDYIAELLIESLFMSAIQDSKMEAARTASVGIHTQMDEFKGKTQQDIAEIYKSIEQSVVKLGCSVVREDEDDGFSLFIIRW